MRYYGSWIRDEAERRIGHLYPKARITEEMAAERPDLERYAGRELTVIAWLWARTVRSPNPAFVDVEAPLVSNFLLSTKKGQEAWVEPLIEDDGYRFDVRVGAPPDSVRSGTKIGRGANFRCVISGTPMAPDYIKAEGLAGRMGARLMAIVAEGDRQRIYLPPAAEQERVARDASPAWRPDLEMPNDRRWFSPPLYGMPRYADIFTERQLTALTTFADLVGEAREKAHQDAIAAGRGAGGADTHPLREGGSGPAAYADGMEVQVRPAQEPDHRLHLPLRGEPPSILFPGAHRTLLSGRSAPQKIVHGNRGAHQW